MAAEIPSGYLEALSAAMDGMTEETRGAALALVEDIIANSESSNPFDLVDEISEALEPLLQANAENVAALSAASYDALRVASVGEAMGAEAYTGRDQEWTKDALYGIAKDHRDNLNAFALGIMDRISYEANKAAGTTMLENGKKDPLKPRFCRVPQSPNPCAFCKMLASRGAVYLTERTAGKYNEWHEHCDCKVVAVYDYLTEGDPSSPRRIPLTKIEGYDPDAYYDEYLRDIADGTLNIYATGKRSASGRHGRNTDSAARGAPTKHLVRKWGGLTGVKGYFDEARDVFDLDERYQRVMQDFKDQRFTEAARNDLRNIVNSIVSMARSAQRTLNDR